MLCFGCWKRFTTGSTNRQVFRAVATIAVLSSLAKLAAIAKELLVARRFGIGSTIEAFLVAVLIPMVAVSVLVDLMASPEEADQLRSYANRLSLVQLSERTISDLELLAN
ncbi:MAG: hypothetical protein ACREA9_06255 [Pyrinomonadaceae bacterium]